MKPFTVLASPLCLVLIAAAPSIRAQYEVLPEPFTSVQGQVSAGLLTTTSATPRTYQVIYDASELAGIPIGSRITGLAFRRAGTGGGSWPPASSSRSITHGI